MSHRVQSIVSNAFISIISHVQRSVQCQIFKPIFRTVGITRPMQNTGRQANGTPTMIQGEQPFHIYHGYSFMIRTIHPKIFLQILSTCNNWYVAFFRVSKCSSSNVITNEAYLLFFELSSWPPRWSCHCDPPNPCDPQDSLLGRQDPLICKISASARVRKHFLSTTIVKCNTLRLEVPRLIVTGLVTGTALILLQPAD